MRPNPLLTSAAVVRWQLEEETTSDDSDEGWQAPFETWEGPAIERVLATLMAVLFGGAAALFVFRTVWITFALALCAARYALVGIVLIFISIYFI